MSVAGGRVALLKPVVYQEINGERHGIAGNYVIADNHQVRFSVGNYDRTQPLTIDPVLNYSTYIGGENQDTAFGIALDAAGDAYIAGSTFSTMYPTQNPESTTPPSDIAFGTAFVSELNPTGTMLLYSTYLGGSGNSTAMFGDQANGIAVDTATPANIYVAGFTYSTDFPVSTTPLQSTFPTGNTGQTAFITKLTPSATGSAQLAYSSFLGGNTQDEALAIAVDATGNAYVAGETASSNFPTMGTQIPNGPNAAGTGFLTKINTTDSGAASLVYSTYLGGSGATSGFLGVADIALGVTIDANSNAYVVGGTDSTNFPTAGTPVPGSTACGANGSSSAFISVISTTNGTLGYSQCLSGSVQEFAFGVSLGTGVPAVTTKVAYITGQTYSSNFPVTTNSIPVAGGSVSNGVAFVSLLNTNSTTPLQYSTFLGGKGGDLGSSIATDSLGNAYVTGTTDSTNFPVTAGALETTLHNTDGVAFVSKIGPNGLGLADLIYSTFYEGQSNNASPATADTGNGIAVSGTNAYVTGQMADPDMLTSTGAYQTTLKTGAVTNAFVADLPMVAGISVSPTFINFGTQATGVASTPQTVTVTNNNPTGSVSFTSITVVPISPAAPATDFAISSQTCGATIAAAATCTVSVTFTPSVNAAESATLVFTDSDPSSPQSVLLSGTGSNTASAIAFNPTSLTFAAQATGTTSAAQMITISNPDTRIALNISAIASTNANFTITNNSCGSTFPITIAVAPGGTPCILSVTFNPSLSTPAGPVTGSITFTDNAGNSPQSVPLSGTATVSTATITINPTSLTFGGQLLTTTSAAKTVTLSNAGAAPVVISSIASSNSDFTITSNSCGSTFPITIAPAGTPCTLMVTFNPASSTAPGADTGSITIADNATGSPQSVSLTGTAWDFSLTGPSGAVSVTSGVATTFPVTVNGLGGFTGMVALTCAGSSNVSACTVTPSTSGPGMVTVSVTATNKSLLAPSSFRTPPAASIRQVAFVVLGIGMLFMIPMTRRFRTRLGLAGAMLVFVVLAGCSGNGHHAATGTATITGTSGGVTKTVTVNLNIT